MAWSVEKFDQQLDSFLNADETSSSLKSVKSKAKFDEFALDSFTEIAEKPSKSIALAADNLDTMGFSAKAERLLADDWGITDIAKPESKSESSGKFSGFSSKYEHLFDEIAEDGVPLASKAYDYLLADTSIEEKSSTRKPPHHPPRQKPSITRADKWDDEAFGKTTTKAFHDEAKESFTGKALTASFHDEAKDSFTGKAFTASFHDEAKDSFTGKAVSASFADKSKKNGDWNSTNAQNTPKTNAHQHDIPSAKTTIKSAQSVAKPAQPQIISNSIEVNNPYQSNSSKNVKSIFDSDELLEDWVKSDSEQVRKAAEINPPKFDTTRKKRYKRTYRDDDIHGQLVRRGLALVIGWPALIITIIILFGYLKLFFCFLVGIIGIPTLRYVRKSRTDILKREIVYNELCRCFDNINYTSNESVSSLSSEQKKVFMQFNAGNNIWNGGDVSDRFDGKYKDMRFQFYDTHLTLTTGSGKSQKTVDIFRGQLIAIQLKCFVTTPFVIQRRRDVLKRTEIEQMKSFGFNSANLQELLNHYEFVPYQYDSVPTGVSKPSVSVRELNLPRLFETLDKISSFANGFTSLRISGDTMYFKLERNKDPFEIESFDSFRDVREIRTRIGREVEEYQYILEQFLNS